MSTSSRWCSEKEFVITVDGSEYPVVVREVPFREGIELSCRIGDEEVRVSDRGLGQQQAVRLLEDEIRLFVTRGHTNEI